MLTLQTVLVPVLVLVLVLGLMLVLGMVVSCWCTGCAARADPYRRYAGWCDG